MLFLGHFRCFWNIDNNQKVNQDFEVHSIKYQLDTEQECDLLSSDTALRPKLQDPPQCKLTSTEVKQLHKQDMHLSKLFQTVKLRVIMIKHLNS